MIAELVNAARMAPNTGNMQLYSVVVTTGADEIAALAREGHFNQPASAGAQALLTFVSICGVSPGGVGSTALPRA